MLSTAVKTEDQVLFKEVGQEDIVVLRGLMHELAIYDHHADSFNHDINEFANNLFREPRFIEPYFIMSGASIAGFFIFYENFWMYQGRRGIYLLGLYVKPEFRRRGYGQQVFNFLFNECKKRDLGQLNWHADVKNELGKNFYAKMGAVVLEEYRLNYIKLS